MEIRVCKSCGIEKNIIEFRKTLCKKNNKFYYRSKCKECESKDNLERTREYYILHKKVSKKTKPYEKYIEEFNGDIEKARTKYKKIKAREYKKYYYYTHQEQRKIKDKLYYQKNKKIIIEKEKEKKKRNIEFKLKKQIRTMLWNSFKRNNHTKKEKSEKILGCGLDYFYKYLLQTFKDNYGYEWDKIEPVHIDHIYPISLAKNEEDITKLCHYSNLQLLKAQDNLEKNDKLDWKLIIER